MQGVSHASYGRALVLLLLCTILLALWPQLTLPRAAAATEPRLYLPIVRSFSAKPSSAVVFVSRQIPSGGSIYYDPGKDLPGVGPHSRFRVAAPGKLMVLEPTGNTRILVDGSKPSAASFNLIDV